MLEILKAILFGIVEGITEWLPISSTGHMILLNEIMPLKVSDAFYSMFEVVIQLGAIMAVVILFWNKLYYLERTIIKNHSHLRVQVLISSVIYSSSGFTFLFRAYLPQLSAYYLMKSLKNFSITTQL